MSEPSDAVPVERLVEHRDFVRALARTLVRDGSRADDLEQEVWLTTLAHPPRHADGLRGWFRRITRSRAIDMARGDVRRERLLAGATSPATPTPAELAARLDAGRRVASAVARLDEPYRAAVLLRFYEGVEPAEIAARTGVPLETVRTRLRRAIDRMRADLDRDAGGRDAWVAALLPIAAWPTGDALTGATGAWAAEAAAGGVAVGTKATVVAAVAGAVIGTVITAQLAGVAAPPVAAPDDVAAATEVSDLRRRVEAVESRAGQAASSATRAVESRMRSQDERIASLEATLRSVESGATGTMPARTNATEQADPAAQRAEGDAAGAKRRTADEVADDLLLKLRRTVADTSQSEATRLEALTALRRMPSGFDRGVVLALTDLFRTSTFADTRDRILRDLHNAKAPDAAADLRQLYLEGLRDADEEVRERAAEDIDTFVSEPEVRQALESVAASDPSKGVRKRAALTLEKVK